MDRNLFFFVNLFYARHVREFARVLFRRSLRKKSSADDDDDDDGDGDDGDDDVGSAALLKRNLNQRIRESPVSPGLAKESIG